MSPYLVPIATILTGICLWTTNVSDIIMYHCHNTRQMLTGADGMQLFALDCIAYIVDAETDRVLACMNDM